MNLGDAFGNKKTGIFTFPQFGLCCFAVKEIMTVLKPQNNGGETTATIEKRGLAG